jgi:hypothetical protein
MSLENFLSGLNEIESFISHTYTSLATKLDQISYRWTIEQLKSPDPEAVKLIIDQLAKEKNPTSIAPLYLVSSAHPTAWVRQRAKEALSQLISESELQACIQDQNTAHAVKSLLNKYGHF